MTYLPLLSSAGVHYMWLCPKCFILNNIPSKLKWSTLLTRNEKRVKWKRERKKGRVRIVCIMERCIIFTILTSTEQHIELHHTISFHQAEEWNKSTASILKTQLFNFINIKVFKTFFSAFLLTNRKQIMYTTDRTPTARLREMNPLHHPPHPKTNHTFSSHPVKKTHWDPPTTVHCLEVCPSATQW